MSDYTEGFTAGVLAGVLAMMFFNLIVNAAIFVLWLNSQDKEEEQ